MAIDLTTTASRNPFSIYHRDFWQKQGTVVAGTWAWAANASQTDWSSVTGEAAGEFSSSATYATLDEYKWANVYLSPGTYTFTIVYIKNTDRGIAELLFGTTSIATQDQYNGSATYNNVWSPTVTITTPTTADLRFRANSKNGSSSNYTVAFSRFSVDKTG